MDKVQKDKKGETAEEGEQPQVVLMKKAVEGEKRRRERPRRTGEGERKMEMIEEGRRNKRRIGEGEGKMKKVVVVEGEESRRRN